MRSSAEGRPLHDVLMTARGWPEVPFDGRLLVTQQDALLMGGKVQAIPGFGDHVRFLDTELCMSCLEKSCIAMCSGQAINLGADGAPAFEREKCVHCGACLWNCARMRPKARRATLNFLPVPEDCIRPKTDRMLSCKTRQLIADTGDLEKELYA